MHTDKSNDDPHDEIVRLEAHIEDLAARIDSCRKFILAGRIAIAGGVIVLIAMLFGAIRPDLTWLAGAMTAILGETASSRAGLPLRSRPWCDAI